MLLAKMTKYLESLNSYSTLMHPLKNSCFPGHLFSAHLMRENILLIIEVDEPKEEVVEFFKQPVHHRLFLLGF